MKTEQVLLAQVKVNEANPRTITSKKLHLLVERLIVFPKMIDLRPIIIDDTMVVLGGNMRVNALNIIAGMSIEEIGNVAGKTKDYRRLTKTEQQSLIEMWQVWLDKPTATIARASDLSDAEKQQFIIADNASFGEWDYDALANGWDSKDLVSWGVDVWDSEPETQSGGTTTGGGTNNNVGGGINTDNLPEELQGQDIDPDELPKIQGSDEVAMERVIIVYPKDKAAEVATMLGLETIEKVVYNFNEL